MITFPIFRNEICLKHSVPISVPQGWLATTNSRWSGKRGAAGDYRTWAHLELFHLTGQRTIVDDDFRHASIDGEEEKLVVLVQNPYSHYDEAQFWSDRGTITPHQGTPGAEPAWTFQINHAHNLHIDRPNHDLHITTTDKHTTVRIPAARHAYLAHDCTTIFVITDTEAIILDNPLIT